MRQPLFTSCLITHSTRLSALRCREDVFDSLPRTVVGYMATLKHDLPLPSMTFRIIHLSPLVQVYLTITVKGLVQSLA